MINVRVYQIVDSVSEGVISSFIAPNSKYALREYKKFLEDPKLKDNIDPEDFVLVCSDDVFIAQTYADAMDNLEIVK